MLITGLVIISGMKFIGLIKESGKHLFRTCNSTRHTLCKQALKDGKFFVRGAIVSGGSTAMNHAVNGKGESTSLMHTVLNLLWQ